MKTAKMLTILVLRSELLRRVALVLALGLLVWQAEVSEAAPMGTAFTYQGRLIDANSAADGLYDFEFKLYDSNDPCTGTQQGGTIDINDLDVIDGHFVVELDFGSDVFNGDARWLETTVSHADGSDPCTLRPRIEITPVPYALHTRGVFVGNYNTFVGREAGYTNTTGNSNTFLGRRAGYSNTTGSSNTFSGFRAGYSNTTGQQNTFSGFRAGYSNTTGNFNTFSGRNAGYSNTTGQQNTFSGNDAGYSNTTGSYNTFLGYWAGLSNTKGHHNTFLGRYAGINNTEGYNNTFSGCQTGFRNHTGNGNVFIGYKAGWNETGSNKLYIANGPSDANVLIYGDFSTGRVGIGTTSPTAKLHIAGTAGVDGVKFPDGTLQTTAAAGGGGDDLGNHIATQNIELNGHWLSGDGGNEGVYVNNLGNVGIGTTSPAEKLEVSGNVKADKLIYHSPRTHYFVVGGEGFVPRDNVNYYNSPHGAFILTGAGSLVASIHLPHGSKVIEFTVFFYDNSTSNITARLMRLSLTVRYELANMAQVDSSGISGLGNEKTTVSFASVDNTLYAYYVEAHSDSWDGSNTKVKGALVAYTISEAP